MGSNSGWEDVPVAPASDGWEDVPVANTDTEGTGLTPAGDGGKSPEPSTQHALASFQAAHTDTPAAAQAETGELSRLTGLSPQFVGPGLDSVKREVRRAGIQAAMEHTPGLAEGTSQWENSSFVEENLGKFFNLAQGVVGHTEHHPVFGSEAGVDEWTAPTWFKVVRDGTAETFQHAYLSGLAAFGLADEDDLRSMRNLEIRTEDAGEYGAENWATKSLVRLGKLAPYAAGSVGARAVGGVLGGGAGAAASGFAFDEFTFFGPAFRQNQQALNPDGTRRYTDGEARTLAGMQSTVGASVAALMGGNPFAAKAQGLVAAKAFEKTLIESMGEKTLAEGLSKVASFATKEGLKDLGKTWAHGVATMGAIMGSQDLTKQLADLGTFRDTDFMGFAQRTIDTMKTAAVDLGALTLTEHGLGLVRGVGRSKEMLLDAKAKELVSAGIKDNPTPPEELEKIIGHMQRKADKPLTYYVNHDELVTYAQENNIADPLSFVADIMGDGGKAFREARTEGGDIAIPAERFIPKLGQTEHWDKIQDIVRTNPELDSVRAVNEAARAAEADVVEGPARKEQGVAEVREHFATKALEGGATETQANASGELASRAFRTFAREEGLGKTALQAFEERVKLSIHGPGEDTSFDFGENLGKPADTVLASQSGYAEGKKAIARMSEGNRVMSLAFLDYVEGRTDKAPDIPAALERRLGALGIVDPEGYGFDEQGRDKRKTRAMGKRYDAQGNVKRGRGPVPSSLRESQVKRGMSATEASKLPWTSYKQEGLTDPRTTADAHALKAALPGLTSEARARETYLDPVSGLRDARAFDETAVPEGKAVAVITSPAVKGINDHATAGGHDVANTMLTAMGRALHGVDEGAARGGTNFRFLVDIGKEKEQLDAAIATVKAGLKNEHVDVIGATGADSEAAFANLRTETDKRRAHPPEHAEHIPAKGALRPGLEVDKLAFDPTKANATVPDVLHEKVKALSDREYFEQTYLDHVWVTGEDGKRVAMPTGLLSAAAFRRLGSLGHTLSVDLKGLSKIPKDPGDRLLLTFARIARETGGEGIRLAHLSGDEFAGTHSDPAVLRRFARALETALDGATIEYLDASGKPVEAPVGFRHGTGVTYSEADRDLNAKRRVEEARAAGLDPGADDARAAGGEAGPGQGEVSGNQLPGQADNLDGRADAERGRNRPQAWPEEVDPALRRLEQAAYHGTGAQDLHGGRFSLEHIGSGEGAQVYGWGLYFAAAKRVAEWYQQKLSGRDLVIRGKDSDSHTPGEQRAARNIAHALLQEDLRATPENIAKAWEDAARYADADVRYGEHKADIARRQMAGREETLARGLGDKKLLTSAIEQDREDIEAGERIARLGRETVAALKAHGPEGFEPKNKGSLFSVDVPEHHELLDYDKPLTEQPPSVRKALDERARKLGNPTSEDFAREGLSGPTGKTIYEGMSRALGGDKAASEALRDAGIPGLRYLDGTSRHAGEGSHNFVIWDENEVKILSKLDQQRRLEVDGGLSLESAGGRGYVSFEPSAPGKTLRRYEIHLGEGADASTLPHELFHILSEVMGDIAQAETASPEIKRDYQTLLEHMGHASHEERQAHGKELRDLLAKDKEERTTEDKARIRALQAKEERATYAFEQYLVEGKAPSEELRPVFRRFKDWIGNLYRSVAEQFKSTYGEELNVSDEVRGVFDRLLASQEEIDRANEATLALSPFEAAREKMTPDERAEYDKVIGEAGEQSEGELLRLLHSDATRSQKAAFIKSEKERIRAEVSEVLDQDPAYKLQRYLKLGDTPDSPGVTPDLFRVEGGKRVKLDRRAVVKEFGKDVAASLPKEAFAGKHEKGIPAEDLAAYFGMDSGDALLAALQRPPREGAIAQETARRIREKFPTLLDKPEDLARAAVDSLHTPAAMRKARLELDAMRRQLTGEDSARSARKTEAAVDKVGKEKAKAEAQRRGELRRILRSRDASAEKKALATSIIEGKTVGELLAGDQGLAGKHQWAERRNAKKAIDAAAKGDLVEAIIHKDHQLTSLALYAEARDVRGELESGLKKLQRADKDDWRAKLGKADVAYLDAHDAILEAVGLSEPQPGRQVPASLEGLLAKAEADAVALPFDVDALRALEASRTLFEDLTVEQARNVIDAVESIRHIARDKNLVTLEGKKLAKDAFFADVQARAADLPQRKRKPRAVSEDRGAAKGLIQLAEAFDAQLVNPEEMIGFLTRGDTANPLHQLLVQGYLDARNQKAELSKVFLKGLLEKFDKLPKELRDKRADLVDIAKDLPFPADLADRGHIDADGRVPRQYLWMIALNMGNEGNKQRLLDGYGWTEAKAMEVLDREMSRAEWDWVQGVWDHLETLWPHIEKLELQETGLRPDKVVATKVLTKHGEYAGGYFPAKYDRRVSGTGAKQAEGSVANLQSPGYVRASTSKGHTKARAVAFDNPVSLDWAVVPGHVNQVLHDIAFRSFVREANGILTDERMQALVRRHLGEEYEKQFQPWLKAVANGAADAVAPNLATINRSISFLRSKVAIQALGYSLPVALGDLSNVAVAVTSGEVKASHLAFAVAKTSGNWGKIRDFSLERSPELRFRAERISKKLSDQFTEMGAVKPRGRLGNIEKAVVEHAFVAMEYSDKLTATPIWFAKYNQGLKEGLSDSDAAKAGDATIRKLFPAEAIAEQPAFQRNRMMGGMVMFYGYMSKMYNLQRSTIRDAALVVRDEKASFASKAGALAHMSGKILATSLAYGALSELLTGRGREDDETWGEWLGRQTLVALASPIPLGGSAVEVAYSIIKKKPLKASIRQTPGLAVMQKTIENIADLVRKSSGDDVDTEKLIWATLNTLGVLRGIPTRGPQRPLQYGTHLVTGEAALPPGVAAVPSAASGVIYGKRDRQPENILSATAEALQ